MSAIIEVSTDPSASYVKLRDSFKEPAPTSTRRPMFSLTTTVDLVAGINKQTLSRRVLERIRHLEISGLARNTRIKGLLDVGTSDGEITSGIANAFNIDPAYGLDVFPIDQFRGPENVRYKQVIDNRINLPDNSVQLLTAFVSMHHFTDFDKMMTEMMRILAPGGYFFFREHDVPPTDYKLIKYLDDMHGEYTDHMTDETHYLHRPVLKQKLISKYGLRHVGDSEYSTYNPQQLYHSLFVKPGPELPKTESTEPEFIDPRERDKLIEITDRIRSIKIPAKLNTDPYSSIPTPLLAGVETTRDGLKLANIDAVYGITQHRTGYLAPHSKDQLIFADLGGGPGGFTQYILWRDIVSKGMGISTPSFQRKYYDSYRFSVNSGSDGTSNIETSTESFPQDFLRRFPEGADLVVADVHTGVHGELENAKIILSELLIAVRIMSEGRSVFVCKIFDTFSLFMAQLLYVCANVFTNIDIFKPITSSPFSSERYLICSGFNKSRAAQAQFVLQQAINSFKDDSVPTSFIQNSLPSEFILWLRTRNLESAELQTIAGQELIKRATGTGLISETRALIIWNLPGPNQMSTSRPESHPRKTKQHKITRRR